jgi:hypothetical protein
MAMWLVGKEASGGMELGMQNSEAEDMNLLA